MLGATESGRWLEYFIRKACEQSVRRDAMNKKRNYRPLRRGGWTVPTSIFSLLPIRLAEKGKSALFVFAFESECTDAFGLLGQYHML